MHRTITSFLVMLEKSHNLGTGGSYRWQRAQPENGVSHSIGKSLIAFAHGRRNPGLSHHTQSHSLSMQVTTISRLRLERVADRVAEIQQLPHTRLALIQQHDSRFNLDGFSDNPFQLGSILTQRRQVDFLKKVKQSRAANDSTLQRLVQARAKLACWKSGK